MLNKGGKIVESGYLNYSQFKDVRMETYLHCIRRYQFAAQFLSSNDTVLDICCGAGYGVNVLSQITPYVTGVDRNTPMIEYARESYPEPFFVAQDIMEFTFNDYDVMTMFECLDHLKKSDGELLLSRVANHCKRMMFVSLPDDQKLGLNPWHIAEWKYEELELIMRNYFHSVVVFGQSWISGVIYYPFEERKSITVIMGIK